MSGLLSKPFIETGLLNFSVLKGFEFQKEYTLDKLLLAQYKINTDSNFVELVIPVENGGIKKHNSLVTDFYFEGILLCGDALKEGSLTVQYALSAPYSFTNTIKEACKLKLPLLME